MSSRAGYVLVGGRSRRMGSDKALLRYRGAALVETVAEAVSQGVGHPLLVGNRDRYDGLGYEVIPDLYPGEGPLGGVLTSLQNSGAEWNLIVACDMPELTGGFLGGLMEAAEGRDCEVLAPVGPDGNIEPLCAVYRRSARPGLQGAFERGVRQMRAALEEVRIVTHFVPELAHFQNVNTPGDWARYAG
ncbi:MAG: molybdenum cofactor guanylyltransferase [Bryobacteraceae bacterium]